jgi:hypothetical protein
MLNTCLLLCACRRRPERCPWTGLSCPCCALWGCAWGSAGAAGFSVETCGEGSCADSCAATFVEGSAWEGSAGAAGFSVETCRGGSCADSSAAISGEGSACAGSQLGGSGGQGVFRVRCAVVCLSSGFCLVTCDKGINIFFIFRVQVRQLIKALSPYCA